MSTAMKFTLDSGDVLFTDDELCQVREMPEQTIIAHKSQQTANFVQVYDAQYKKWQVSILDVTGTTQGRILQIINELDEMVFYPHMEYDSSVSYNVILLPDEVKKYYAFGRREALNKTTFNLLESSK